MLEQRRAKEKGYITLKEAAELANYSPDYIGQLIRAGKIRGEQVYSNVAWVTTEDEIQAYLADKGRSVAEADTHPDIFSHPLFKYSLYISIALIAVVLLFLQYVLYVSIDTHLSEWFISSANAATTVVE